LAAGLNGFAKATDSLYDRVTTVRDAAATQSCDLATVADSCDIQRTARNQAPSRIVRTP